MNPIVVTIPHSGDKADANRRIKAAIESAQTRYGAKLKIAEQKWDGDHLDFRIAALGQTVTGKIDVGDKDVTVDEDRTLLGASVLGNDADIDGDSLVAVLDDGPRNGSPM